jgi:hypothetical protein
MMIYRRVWGCRFYEWSFQNGPLVAIQPERYNSYTLRCVCVCAYVLVFVAFESLDRSHL